MHGWALAESASGCGQLDILIETRETSLAHAWHKTRQFGVDKTALQLCLLVSSVLNLNSLGSWGCQLHIYVCLSQVVGWLDNLDEIVFLVNC